MRKDHDFLDQVKKNWKYCSDAESTARAKMLDDWKFWHGEHWDETDKRDRLANDRPCPVVPRMNQFIHQITNDQRQNKPSFKISPTGAESKEIAEKRYKAAERRSGLIKSIVYHSQAENAIQNAFDHAVIMGRGFYRIKTDYLNPESFDQEILVDKIENPLSVYMDPDRTRLDYSDCDWGFIVSKISKDKFKKEYPKAEFTDWTTTDHQEFWVREDEITICEYYYFKIKDDILYQFEDNSRMLKSEIQDEAAFKKLKIVNERPTKTKQLVWCKLTALEKLGGDIELPGDRIPIFPIIGEEAKVGQELIISGLVRKVKDSQKMYDYWTGAEQEWLASSTKAQYIIEESQIEGYEDIWSSSSLRNYTVLPYKAKNTGGQSLPAPQKTQPQPIPSGYIQAKMGCIDDMKAETGIYDAGLGNRSNETSGKAIIARQREGDTANYHYTDNERISLTSAGQLILDWIPTYYDTQRVLRILGEDDKDETIELFGEDKDGNEINFGDGYYGCQVTMGPSYSTQRQEAAESMIQFMEVYPEARAIIGDLVAGNMDWPKADKISERLKTLLPPGMADSDDEDNPELMMMQQAIQAREEEMQAMGQQLQQLEQEKGNEQGKLQIEAQKNQIEQFKADTDRMKMEADAAKAQADAQAKIQSATPSQAPNELSADAKIKAETEIVKTQLNIEAKKEEQERALAVDENTINNGQVIREQITTKMDENLAKITELVIDSTEEIKSREPKETLVKKTSDNEYTATTTDQNGNESVAVVTKVKDGYKIKDK